MATTPNRGYQLPAPGSKLKDDVLRLIAALGAIDTDVAGLLTTLAGKSDLGHGHAMAEISGLVAALGNKLDVGYHDALANLTDVDVAGVANGMALLRQASKWIPVALQINNIAGLESALGGKATLADITSAINALVGAAPGALNTLNELADALGDDPNFAATMTAALAGKAPLASPALTGNPTAPTQAAGNSSTRIATTAFVMAALGSVTDFWANQPIGVPIGVMDNLAGVTAPATDKAYRYIKLTASDAYNDTILTSETISGSAPDLTATAVILLAGSPMNGDTVPLINTDRRFLRAGAAGTKEQSQNKSHSHTGTAASAGNHSHSIDLYNAGNFGNNVGRRLDNNTQQGSANTNSGGAHTHTLTINADGGTEARPASLGVTYYMRIK